MSTALVRDFGVVRAALSSWPVDRAVEGDLLPATTRLLHAMRMAVEQPLAVGPADLAVLVRQVLRHEAEETQSLPTLAVPTSTPWPTEDRWRAHGFDIVGRGDGRLQIVANEWLPDWLSTTSDPAAAAFRGRRHKDPEPERWPSDGFFRDATGREMYRSTGQRDAVRWLMASPLGATLVANLPTGSGKSSVGYLPALMNRRGTTVFVIPTTSLAIDQERAFCELVAARDDRAAFPTDYAYYGELPDETKRAFRDRIADGSQRILFVSPEAVSGSLASALYRAAERGLLTAFVVDEAHVVAQWGAEFRPAFQAIAGLRDDLLRVCSDQEHPLPRTVLLSATLTQDSLDTLGVLFGRPGPAAVVSSTALRHEPSYWIDVAQTEEVRHERLLQALRHLPRPAVVYTSRVDDAVELHALLRSEGWTRSHVVTGRSRADERREAIDRLREQSLDVVVATSAFGLGVDQPDVRTVIHACLPETIDRWYQEVGRGGRDGHPSVAMLLPAPRDLADAKGLSTRKIISVDRGRERWDAMDAAGERLDGGRRRLPLSAIPADLDIDSRRNRAWNLRTLLLLHRAGALAVEAEAPPRRLRDEDDASWAARLGEAFEAHSEHAIVRMRASLDDDEQWDLSVADARRRVRTADEEAHEWMLAALVADAQICEILRRTYHINQPSPGLEVPLPIRVAPSCGGCPACRRAGLAARQLIPPLAATVIGGPHRAWQSSWLVAMTRRAPLVALAAPDDEQAIRRGIDRLAARGLWVLDPGHLAGEFRDLHRRSSHGAVFEDAGWMPWGAPELPTTLIRTEAPPATYELAEPGPPRVVIVHHDATDPRHGHEPIARYHPNVVRLEHLVQQI